MNLAAYFRDHQGTGVLATADAQGVVDMALYATPHVVDDNTIAFIMRPRLSRQNLETNPLAAYMFIENSPGYKGKRLYLRMLKEEKDIDKVNAMRRSHHGGDEAAATLVYFTIEHIRPLVGDHE
ncbi:MAG TPA: pyridoxamine 5'-phosphate oxidase family protein [Anaerohalosphaeraceae bacterium]|nr:pyridoxamine 5'-phosphate oxidase family protein [Anaerohalosphaeraceae bacterium]